MTELQTERNKAEPEGTGMPSWLGILLAPVIIPVALLVKLVAWPFEKPVQRTRSEVAAALVAYLNRSVSNSAWDAFVCVPIADARLESMRKFCVTLPWVPSSPDETWLPPENEATIRGYIAELEGAA